jgi:phage gpG-like protein
MGVEITGLDLANRQLNIMADRFTPSLALTLRQIGEAAKGHMQTRYLSGSPLKVRTDKLRSGWHVRGFRVGNDYAVQVGTNTAYARVHNDGFKGVQQVKAHTRSAPTGRGGRRPPRSPQAKLARRRDARAAGEHRSRLNAQSRASHGLSRQQLGVLKRQQRKDRGIQRGAFGARPAAREGQPVRVRAHDRFMKLRAHHYVERTLRDIQPRAKQLLELHHKRVSGGAT